MLGGKRMNATAQRGVMLLEALIAILIFSIGILGLVAMQGTAISNISDAKYRTDAGFLADQLIAQIWVDRANLASYSYPSGGTVPTVLTTWMAQVNAALPQSVANPPVIVVDTTTGAVDITMKWLLPSSEAGATPRKYRAVTLVLSP
jgi:type IV pilus assembly protein PilV